MHMIGQSKMNEKLPGMTPHEKSLDVNVCQCIYHQRKKIEKINICNWHLILTKIDDSESQ